MTLDGEGSVVWMVNHNDDSSSSQVEIESPRPPSGMNPDDWQDLQMADAAWLEEARRIRENFPSAPPSEVAFSSGPPSDVNPDDWLDSQMADDMWLEEMRNISRLNLAELCPGYVPRSQAPQSVSPSFSSVGLNPEEKGEDLKKCLGLLLLTHLKSQW